MKVSYVNGICVKNDAISAAIHQEILWLTSTKRHTVRLFAYVCEYKDVLFTKVDHLSEVAYDDFFQSSDLIIFHFGVFYPFFDLLMMAPATRVVVFHNITPPSLVARVHLQTVEKSFRQMSNIQFSDYVICASQTNQDMLRENGISVDGSVAPLAVRGMPEKIPVKSSRNDGRVRLVFIGRFVKSKGPMDLMFALEQLLDSIDRICVNLDLISNLNFADPSVFEEIELMSGNIQRRFGSRTEINIHGNASDVTKERLLSAADIFILPTYHEGFCIPIVEALGNGCIVICYDNSNTPSISGGLAKLVPTGDTKALSLALRTSAEMIGTTEWLGSGEASFEQYASRAREHAHRYSPDVSKQFFINLIEKIQTTKHPRICARV